MGPFLRSFQGAEAHKLFFWGPKMGGFGLGPKSLCWKCLCAFSAPYLLPDRALVFFVNLWALWGSLDLGLSVPICPFPVLSHRPVNGPFFGVAVFHHRGAPENSPLAPKGPKIEKIRDCPRDWIFKRDWNFQACHPPRPYFCGEFWRPRLKFSIEIKNFQARLKVS